MRAASASTSRRGFDAIGAYTAGDTPEFDGARASGASVAGDTPVFAGADFAVFGDAMYVGASFIGAISVIGAIIVGETSTIGACAVTVASGDTLESGDLSFARGATRSHTESNVSSFSPKPKMSSIRTSPNIIVTINYV
jgi:hypothetical protein